MISVAFFRKNSCHFGRSRIRKYIVRIRKQTFSQPKCPPLFWWKSRRMYPYAYNARINGSISFYSNLHFIAQICQIHKTLMYFTIYVDCRRGWHNINMIHIMIIIIKLYILSLFLGKALNSKIFRLQSAFPGLLSYSHLVFTFLLHYYITNINKIIHAQLK